MKFYLGYILSQGDDLIDEIGLNPWIVKEGRADPKDAHEVDWEIAKKYNLSYSGATAWFNKNYLNKESSPRGEMRIYFLLYEGGYEGSPSRHYFFKSRRTEEELTDEFLAKQFNINLKSGDLDLILIDIEELREI